MRMVRTELGGFQNWLWANQATLNSKHKRFTQQPEHWSLFFLEHDGNIVINNRMYPYRNGNVAFIAPGTKVEFPYIGENTNHYQLTFAIVPRTEVVVIPVVGDFGDQTETRRQECIDAFEWLHISIMRGLAFAYNALWSLAEPLHEFRKSDLMYDAETLIIQRLGEKIEIGEMAQELGLSHSHLLRLFREEHGSTIQEFIREKRAEVARQMITDTDKSLKEIAIRVGMSDLQYFNKVIRASTGLSPRALREQTLGRTRH